MSDAPAVVRRLMETAEESISQFRRDHGLSPTLFVAADYVQVYRALKQAAQPGESFLEWGSGVGGITILADLLGFEAYGIEIEPDLVDIAEDLAERNDSNAKFASGTFVPSEFDWTTEHVDSDFHTDPSGEDGYEVLEMAIGEFDLIYAYPWPGEEGLLREIFDRFAHPGALFVTYNGLDGIQTHRKPMAVPD